MYSLQTTVSMNCQTQAFKFSQGHNCTSKVWHNICVNTLTVILVWHVAHKLTGKTNDLLLGEYCPTGSQEHGIVYHILYYVTLPQLLWRGTGTSGSVFHNPKDRVTKIRRKWGGGFSSSLRWCLLTRLLAAMKPRGKWEEICINPLSDVLPMLWLFKQQLRTTAEKTST